MNEPLQENSGLHALQAEIEDVLPFGQWRQGEGDHCFVIGWLEQLLARYFEEEILPDLDLGEQGSWELKRERDYRLGKDGELEPNIPPHYGDIQFPSVYENKLRKALDSSSLFTNGLKDPNQSLSDFRMRVLSVNNEGDKSPNELATIKFEIACNVTPKRAKDGNPGYYPIKFDLVLGKWPWDRMGKNQFSIRLKRARNSLDKAKRITERDVEDSRDEYRRRTAMGLATTFQGGLPSLGKGSR